MEYYNYIKALHLIFVITWFAGLFYIPRLFIYHIEANTKPPTEKEILNPDIYFRRLEHYNGLKIMQPTKFHQSQTKHKY